MRIGAPIPNNLNIFIKKKTWESGKDCSFKLWLEVHLILFGFHFGIFFATLWLIFHVSKLKKIPLFQLWRTTNSPRADGTAAPIYPTGTDMAKMIYPIGRSVKIY